jgi:hypothetical protein
LPILLVPTILGKRVERRAETTFSSQAASVYTPAQIACKYFRCLNFQGGERGLPRCWLIIEVGKERGESLASPHIGLALTLAPNVGMRDDQDFDLGADRFCKGIPSRRSQQHNRK